jgi:hypothetical protein
MRLWGKVSKFNTLFTSNSLQLNPSLAIYVFDGLYFNSKSYEVIKMYNLTWTKVENTCKDHNIEVTLFQWYPQSNEIFIKSKYEMVKLSI